MADKEQAHQHDLNRDFQEKDFALRKRGQDRAMAVFVLVAIIGLVALWLGYPWPGSLISISGVAGIIASFLSKR